MASPLWAQELAPSEEAALSQREATEKEIQRRIEGCALPEFGNETLDVQSGVTGPFVDLPALSFLKIAAVVFEGTEKGTFALKSFRDLPNGGISGFDFCSSATIDTIVRPTASGDEVRYSAVLLRTNLDLEAEYPNTSIAINERGQLLNTPKGKYLFLNIEEPAVSAWYEREGALWISRNGTGPAIILGTTLAVRMGD